MKTSEKDLLKIGSHNIQGGIIKKLGFNDVSKFVKDLDIFLFQETWLVDSTAMAIPGYQIFRSDRGKHRKKNTGSGGVCTVFKSYLKGGIQKIVSSNSDFLWTKLDKHFFGLKQDLYLCNCYIPLETSEVHKAGGKSYFEILKDEVVKFSTLGEIILFGDMNSRTGELKEKYTDLDDDITVREQIYIERVSSTEGLENKITDRNNEETRVNSYGRKLISLTEQVHLAIVNGRKLGDTRGKTTCVTYNGMSTVDYCIVSTSMFDEIVSFSVLDQRWYSDHNPVTCSLKTKIVTERENKIQEGNLSPILKLLWG